MVMQNKLDDIFNKECARCHVLKNIDKYKRNKKTNKVCNDCSLISGKKVCPKCLIKKFINEFQRYSQININCNKCAKDSEEFISKAFNNAFSLFNQSIKGRKRCTPR